jgi:hypothetical protein
MEYSSFYVYHVFNFISNAGYKQVKLSLYQAMEAHRFETSRLPQYLDNRFTDGGKVVKPYAPAALYTPGRFLVLISVRG